MLLSMVFHSLLSFSIDTESFCDTTKVFFYRSTARSEGVCCHTFPLPDLILVPVGTRVLHVCLRVWTKSRRIRRHYGGVQRSMFFFFVEHHDQCIILVKRSPYILKYCVPLLRFGVDLNKYCYWTKTGSFLIKQFVSVKFSCL